jgi:hypothetical protein
VQEVDGLAHTVINGVGVAGLAMGIVKGEQVHAKGSG